MENTGDRNEILNSLISFTRLMIRNSKLIGGITFAAILIAIVFTLVVPYRFTSTATILPSGKRDNFSALRELAGFGGSSFDLSENSSALFPEIIKSNQIRDAVVNATYRYKDGDETKTMNLKEFFKTDNPELFRDALGAITAVSTDIVTGIITISVETEYPDLSQAIVRQTIAELGNFNLNIRRSQAKDSERYLAREMRARQQELEQAELNLEEFQNANRGWYDSSDPEILSTLARLKRDIEINSTAYILLREQHELARLGVQKDIPVVSILDPPSYPTIKSWPRRKIIVISTALIVFFLTIILVLLWDAYKKFSKGPNRDSFSTLAKDFRQAIPLINRITLRRGIGHKETADKTGE
jgi:uncharacterized protein involved in exopolysaccharide biosynthesis